MIQPLLSVSASGGAPTDAIDAVRDAQAALRASARLRGETASGGPRTETARPVIDAAQAETTRLPADIAKTARAERDPALTGPKPTFSKTPLEKMRADVMLGEAGKPADAKPTPPAPANAVDTADPANAVNTADKVDETAQGALFGAAAATVPTPRTGNPAPTPYEGLRKISQTGSSGAEMNFFR